MNNSWMKTLTDEQKVEYVRERAHQIQQECEKLSAWNKGMETMLKFSIAAWRSR